MDITGCPGGEWEKVYLVCRGLVKLSETGLSFVSVGVCQMFLESQHSHIAVFEDKCEIWPVDWS